MNVSPKPLLMKTTSWVRARRAIGASLLLMLLLIGEARAQDYTYTTNEGAITITRYIGPGGNVIVPSTINGLPVKTIGAGAFFFLPAVTSVTIPEGVTTIGVGAFQGSQNLLDITLPVSLTSIGDMAFWDCSGLVQINIPSSVTNIGTTAFAQCINLVAITVDSANGAYRSVEGVLFDKDQWTLIQFPGGKAGNYTIPNGVTNIGFMAFWWNPSVTSVTMPEGIISIGGRCVW